MGENVNRNSEGGILLIFSKAAGIRKELTDVSERKGGVFLPREETGLTEDLVLPLIYDAGEWKIMGKTFGEGAPFYFHTKRKEKLLLLLGKKAKTLHPAGQISLTQKRVIQIGSAFHNEIFYQCYSLVEACHVTIAPEGAGWVIKGYDERTMYLNGKAVWGKVRLKANDCIDLYGLHILVLEKLLVCVCFCGICRVAEGYGTQEKSESSRPGKTEKETWIERPCNRERELYGGEVEIMLPERAGTERRAPLLLGLGPSLTMVLPVLLMAQLGKTMAGDVGGSFYYMSVAMSGSSAFLALFWGLVNHWYTKKMQRNEGKEKERQYREYLNAMERQLSEWSGENRKILEERYPPLPQVGGNQDTEAVVLWNRYYRQKGFLALRLGRGEMPFQVKVRLSSSRQHIVQGKLAMEGREMAEKFQILKQVPVVVDFYENRQVGLTGSLYRDGKGELLLQLILQIALCHCYTEVKIVCFYRKERSWDRKIADCIRWMSHSWSPCRKIRYLAGNEKEAGEILPVLTRELLGEEKKGEKGISIPWYMVILLDQELVREETLYQYLTDPEGRYPVSVLYAGVEREELPKCCRYLISGSEGAGEILDLGEEQITRQKVSLEACSYEKGQAYVRSTAGFRVREEEGDGMIPEKVSFLQLYGCSRVEELESGRRWKRFEAGGRLKVPIGCGVGGSMVNLDIHEKFHGPHGLIAGTTGSGKSELLQTYLLSAAVSFAPADVNFFMIDYKGGGTGNALKELPHCAGVISNLSGNQIKRAMWAIISENRRRQRLLSSCQVNHIDAYTRLYREKKTKIPMPHLILVVDEFAELKKEAPEFMQEIISLAQVGRSLGIHLILSTQKPAGTVDDKIWSNARFRLCLRVQDRQDSMDMLHNGDAAMLTAPGQCYFQMGNYEHYQLFQAGYCGGSYAGEKMQKPRAALVENTGKRLELRGKTKEGEVSQIQALVNYIKQVAKEEQYAPAQSLWLPELPERVLLEELQTMEAQKGILLGLCDDPENQCRLVFAYRPWTQGHLAVCGGPSTGKTTFLKTILWQLTMAFEPWEAWTLAVSLGRGGLGCFSSMPGCLGVLEEKERKEIFFYHLEKLLKERKKLLSGISCEQYNKSERERLPWIFLVIDDFGSLNKILEEEEQELLHKIAAEGPGIGVYLILSAGAAGEIGGRLYEKIKTTVALEMSDRFQYGDVLRQYYIPVLPKENQKGRGLCKVQDRILEFQTALGTKEQEDHAYIRMIREKGGERERELLRAGKRLPAKIPVIPQNADYEMLAKEFRQEKDSIPLGYCLTTGKRQMLSLEKKSCFLISGTERTGRSTLLRCMIAGVLERGFQAALLDTEKRWKDMEQWEGLLYLTELSQIEGLQKKFEGQEDKGESGTKRGNCVFIGDMGGFCRLLYSFGEGKEKRCGFWEHAARGKTDILLLVGIYHPMRDYEAAGTVFFREFTFWQQGIHLGGNAGEQRALSFDDLSYTEQNLRQTPGIGFFKEGTGAKTRRLLLPQYGKEEKNV